MGINDIRKTKIVCTIGPASEKKEVLEQLVKAGMNVMRLNFSHGTHEEHAKKINTLIEINKELGTHVAMLLDTKGPEIRTGDFEGGQTEFKEGQQCIICTEDIVGTSDKFTITYKDLYKDVKENGVILVNDGQISLRINKIENSNIICTCENDGVVKNKRGINVPNIKLGFDYLSEKDKEDLIFGCGQPFSYIAASFVRRPQDVLDIKKLLIQNGRNDIQVIAKIENVEGVENINEIIDVADGIMVARGDLGVEVPAEDVPDLQKMIIRRCNRKGKIVITATQMLESMQQNPRPTRAEVSDVANAIYDGTDAIMLSGESANGLYPVKAVEMMDKIARKTEENLDYERLQYEAIKYAGSDTSEAICMSVAEIAYKFNVSAIIAFTQTGFTAHKMSRYRTKAPIIAPTSYETTMNSLALNWGVKTVYCDQLNSRSTMVQLAHIIAKENGFPTGSLVMVTAGTPGLPGATNYLELITVK